MTRIYFFSFTVLMNMVFMKLFIAIVLRTFKNTQDKENKFMNSSLSDHFREVWSFFDPDVSCWTKLNWLIGNEFYQSDNVPSFPHSTGRTPGLGLHLRTQLHQTARVPCGDLATKVQLEGRVPVHGSVRTSDPHNDNQAWDYQLFNQEQALRDSRQR